MKKDYLKKKTNFLPSRIIKNKNGNLIKILEKKKIFNNNFKECYISEIKPNKIKAWRFHNKLSQNIFIIDGKCLVVIILNKKFRKILLSEKKPGILKIPCKHWYGFKNLSKKRKVRILNFIDRPYQEEEIIRKTTKSFKYKWNQKI